MSDGDSVRTAAESTSEGLTAVFGEAAPSTVFSDPIEAGDDLVITAAAWERAGGFGFGGGAGSDEGGDTGEGAGGGGGGASQGRPVAVIRITSDGVEVKPVIDFTKIGVTVFLAALRVMRALGR